MDLDSDGDDLRPCKRPKAEGGGAPARAAATADYDSAGATMVYHANQLPPSPPAEWQCKDLLGCLGGTPTHPRLRGFRDSNNPSSKWSVFANVQAVLWLICANRPFGSCTNEPFTIASGSRAFCAISQVICLPLMRKRANNSSTEAKWVGWFGAQSHLPRVVPTATHVDDAAIGQPSNTQTEHRDFVVFLNLEDPSPGLGLVGSGPDPKRRRFLNTFRRSNFWGLPLGWGLKNMPGPGQPCPPGITKPSGCLLGDPRKCKCKCIFENKI